LEMGRGGKEGGRGDIRAGRTRSDERLQHVKISEVHLADDYGGGVDACCC
jgi:hypothetical protein